MIGSSRGYTGADVLAQTTPSGTGEASYSWRATACQGLDPSSRLRRTGCLVERGVPLGPNAYRRWRKGAQHAASSWSFNRSRRIAMPTADARVTARCDGERVCYGSMVVAPDGTVHCTTFPTPIRRFADVAHPLCDELGLPTSDRPSYPTRRATQRDVESQALASTEKRQKGRATHRIHRRVGVEWMTYSRADLVASAMMAVLVA